MENRVATIDGLRGFVALYVALIHTNQFGQTGPFTNLMVFIFFSISGYLVFGSMQRRFAVEQAPFKNFYLRRALRILPLWWLVLLFDYLRGTFDLKVLLLNATMLFGFVSYNKTNLPIQPSWSLFVEEVFYFVFPLLFFLLQKRALIVLLLISLAIANAWTELFPLSTLSPVGPGDPFLFRFPLANFPYFFIGILVLEMQSVPQFWERLTGLVQRSRVPWFDLATLAALTTLRGNTIMYFCCSLLAVLVCALTPGTLLNRLVHLHALRWCGVRCYGIYILHDPIYRFLEGKLPTLPGHWSFLTTIITPFGCVLAAAALSFIFLEGPMNRIQRKLINRFEVSRAALAPIRSPA